MTLACRPLIAVLLLSFASGNLSAKVKPNVPAAATACTDFYSFTNKDWLAANPLPAGAVSFSRWDQLNSVAEQQTRELLAKSQASNPGAASRLLADLVASAYDEASLDAAAHAAAAPLLVKIDAMRKPKDVALTVAALHAAGVPVLFGFDALRDPENGQPRATLYPGGIGLPDPAFYNSSEPELQLVARLYAVYLRAMLEFSGVSEKTMTQQADWAYATEKSLASAMGPAASELMTVDRANQAYPALFISDFMQAQGSAPAALSVYQPSFFQALDKMLAKPSIPQWQAYLRAQVGRSLVSTMAQDLRQPYLAALKLAQSPSAKVLPADRLAKLANVEASSLLSAAFSETYLNPGHKQQADAIGEAIRASMGRAIDRASWLSADAKTASQTKLAAMRLLIGQPIEPLSFDGLVLDRRSYAGNVLALRRWDRSRSLALLSSAIWPWPISQSQPAIGYQPSENRLIVTAAAVNPPALDAKSSASAYGSLGALLAQQMSLGFADYTGVDGAALAQRQAGLATQYDAYPATDVMKVSGSRTLRQNAADLAAIEIAWDAFSAQGAPDALASKEFFNAWASVWARQDGPAALALAQAQSPFAPARWRVNGPLSNTPSFAKSYACKAGQAMSRARQDQLGIWR